MYLKTTVQEGRFGGTCSFEVAVYMTSGRQKASSAGDTDLPAITSCCDEDAHVLSRFISCKAATVIHCSYWSEGKKQKMCARPDARPELMFARTRQI